jgi:ABC-2 type transport system ATP-binding protein
LAGIQAEGLEKKFGSVMAVDGLSFEVDEGEVFGLLGPNGAGKTTTVRLLACLISPTSGWAKICGFNIAEEPTKVRERVGILTENPCLYERLTAYENMDFFAQAYGISLEVDRRKRIRELLEFFDLWDGKTQKVATFSKGMKQKLAIARAVIHRPLVLLLDEPTAGLDPESAMSVRDMVTQLSTRENCTILLSTHRLEDSEKLCDHVMIIGRGKRIVVGTPESLLRMAGPPTLEVILKNGAFDVADSIRNIADIKELVEDGSKRLLVTLDDPDAATPRVVAAIVHAGGQVLSVRVLRPSLEDAYLKLIKDADLQ